MNKDNLIAIGGTTGEFDWGTYKLGNSPDGEGNGDSYFSRVGNLVSSELASFKDIVVKGIPLTGVSAAVGLYNTLPTVANAVGGKGTLEYINTLGVANKLDESFSTNGSFSNYYNDNAQGIELAGSIAGSIIPGTLAVKGLRMASAGVGRAAVNLAKMESDHIVGKSAAWLAGMVATTPKTRILQASYDAALLGQSAVTTLLPAARFQYALAVGGQAALEAAVFETASVAFQHTNPTYADINDLGDFTKHIGIAATFGGALGGVFGSLTWKSTEFLPSPGAAATTTLREATNIFGRAREGILDVKDFGQKMESIPSGDKIAAAFDDFFVKQTDPLVHVQDLVNFVPKDKHDLLIRSANEWLAKRESTLDTIIKTELNNLVKVAGKDTNIGDDLYQALIKNTDGTLLKNPDELAQIFGGADSVDFVRLGRGRYANVAEEIVKASPEQNQLYRDLLDSSLTGQKLRDFANERTQIKEFFENAGFKKIPSKAATPAELQPLWSRYSEIGKLIKDTPDLKDYAKLYKNIDELTPEAIAKYGIDPEKAAGVLESTAFKYRKSSAQYYDLVSGVHVERPTLVLGDLLRNKAAIRVSGGNVIANGGTVLLKDLSGAVHSSTLPANLIEANARWHFAGQFITPKSGDKLLFADGEFNPFKLAAAIEKNIPIFHNGVELNREVALAQLSATKKTMYAYAKESLNMSEDAARLYADLPALEVIDDAWRGVRGRENDFLSRRNVLINYKTEQTLDEFQAKSVAAIRANVLTEQIQAAEKGYQIAEQLGIEIPPLIQEMMTSLRQHAINGENPLDLANRIGAGSITNASGRMFTLNTNVTAVGSFIFSKMQDLEAGIKRELSPHIAAILRGTGKDAELDILRTIHKKVQGGGSKYFDAAKLGDIGAALSAASPEGMTFVSRDIARLLHKGETSIEDVFSKIAENPSKHMFTVENPNVVKLLRTYSELEGAQRNAQIGIMASRGANRIESIPGELYFPPIDTSRLKHFVMVRNDSDAAIGGFSRYSFVHAVNDKELAKKVSKLQQEAPELSVFRPEDIALDKKLKGEFERAKAFYSYSVDSDLQSKGILSEFLPRNGNEILDEMQTHLVDASRRNIRSLVKNWTGDFIDHNDRLANTLDAFAKSTHGQRAGNNSFVPKADNSYSQANRSLLNIGPGEDADGVLGMAVRGQNRLIEWVDEVATTARNFSDSTKNNRPSKAAQFEERLHNIVEEGKKIGVDYSLMNTALFIDAEQKYGRAFLTSNVTRRLNTLSAMLTLGLDFWNPIVQSLSLPVTINSAIRQLLADAPPNVKQALEGVQIGGRAARLGAKASVDYWKDITKIASFDRWKNGMPLKQGEMEAIQKWIATPNGRFINEMSDLGLLPPTRRQMMVELSDLTDMRGLSDRLIFDKLKKVTEWGSFPTRYAELFQRYAALKVADGIAEIAGLQGANKLNLLHSFATQSAGVYTAAQRPGFFQGAIGSSFGLYKSYAINMLQALGRHIENRDVAALLSTGALQGTIFGAKAIPGADQLNSYIRAQNEEDNRDLFTTAQILLGESAGHAALYGLPSMFLGANLYSRGDLRPTGVVGNPLDVAQYPALAQLTGVVASTARAANQIAGGVSVPTAMLNALAHQSLSRPAARLSEYALGQQTTAQGSLVQPIDNSEPLWDWNLLVRMGGARPVDEAIFADAYYRENQYKREQSEGMKRLRINARTKMSQGEEIDFDELADDFLKNGGNPRELRNWIRRQYKESSIPASEKLRLQLLKSPRMEHAQQLDIPSTD